MFTEPCICMCMRVLSNHRLGLPWTCTLWSQWYVSRAETPPSHSRRCQVCQTSSQSVGLFNGGTVFSRRLLTGVLFTNYSFYLTLPLEPFMSKLFVPLWAVHYSTHTTELQERCRGDIVFKADKIVGIILVPSTKCQWDFFCWHFRFPQILIWDKHTLTGFCSAI